MREISFTIMGKPKPLKRHRDIKPITKNGHTFTPKYDPSKADKDTFLALAHQHRPEQPINSPIKLKVIFYFARPKSHYRTKLKNLLRPSAPKLHIGRPDTDNLVKFVADSLNGVFWKDDSLICRTDATKVYDEYARTEMHILY